LINWGSMGLIKTIIFDKLRLHITVTFFIFLVSSLKTYTFISELLTISICFSMWHFSVYLLNKAYDVKEDTYMRKGNLSPVEKKVYTGISFCVLFLPVFILQLSGCKLWPYIVVMPLGIFYSVPLGNFRVKNVLLLKNLYASISTVGVPTLVLRVYGEVDIAQLEFILGYILYFFLLFLTVELYSDVPDMEADRCSGVKTLANTFGADFTIRLCLLILMICLLIACYLQNVYMGIIPVLLISVLLLEKNISKRAAISLFFYGFLILLVVLSFTGKIFNQIGG
jgi:4-hydroxybenzoate polyprenyltransferase